VEFETDIEEFQQYNPVSLGIVAHVKEKIRNIVKDEILNVISNISFDDIVYYYYNNNDEIYLNRGVSIGNISNHNFKNDFVLTDAIRKTIKIIEEEDYETKKIIVITDDYKEKMNHSLKMTLRYIKSKNTSIDFNFITIGFNGNTEFLEKNFNFNNVEEVKEISNLLI
jgi:hypothetical protein